MLTEVQEKWVEHLSNTDKIKIIPFDPASEQEFEEVKNLIQSKLGPEVKVEHHGSSSFGISGQNEIDIYIPVSSNDFQSFIPKLTEIFGQPKSVYSDRVRFIVSSKPKSIDARLVNEDLENWKDILKFEQYLKTHPDAMEEYSQLKQSMDGFTTREYYRNKTEFFNKILEIING